MYTVDYFIKKFEAIPEENWCIGRYYDNGKYCAFGHCGMTFNSIISQVPESRALSEIISKDIVAINDGYSKEYQQPTAKQRILAALYDIKANQAVKQAEEIINEQTQIVV